MAFFEKEVGTSRCGFDWFPSSMSSVDFLAMNPFLGGQSDSFPLVTPRRQKLNGRSLLPASHGVSFLDAVALNNSTEHAVQSKTASDTDSGTTTTTTTAAERSVHSHVNKQKSLYKVLLYQKNGVHKTFSLFASSCRPSFVVRGRKRDGVRTETNVRYRHRVLVSYITHDAVLFQ